MQGTIKLIGFLLTCVLTFSNLQAQGVSFPLDHDDLVSILTRGEKGIKQIDEKNGKEAYKKLVEAVQNLVQIDPSDANKVVLKRDPSIEVIRVTFSSSYEPTAVVPASQAGSNGFGTILIMGDGKSPLDFSFSWHGDLNSADNQAALRAKIIEALKAAGYEIDADGHIVGTNLNVSDLVAKFNSRVTGGNDTPSTQNPTGGNQVPGTSQNPNGGNLAPSSSGLSAFEEGLRSGGGSGFNISGGGIGLTGPGGFNLSGFNGGPANGLAGLQNLIISLQGAGLNPNALFGQFGSDPVLAQIIAGIKDGSKTMDDLKAYLQSKYGIQDPNVLAQLANLLGNGGLNLSLFAPGNSSNPNDINALLAQLLGAGGSLNINGAGGLGNNDINALLAQLLGGGGKLNINGTGGLGNNDINALLAQLLGGGGNLSIGGDLSGLLSTLLSNSGADVSKIPALLQLIMSGATPDQIRAALKDAGVTDEAKLNDLLNQIAKLRQNPGANNAGGLDLSSIFSNGSGFGPGKGLASGSGAGSFTGGGSYGFVEIPETGELQVRNPDGSFSYYKIQDQGGKRVAVDGSGKVVFEFDGKGWKLVGSPSAAPGSNPSNPSAPNYVDPAVKFLIEAGINPGLVGYTLPASGDVRGVWGQANGRFFMTGFDSPVSIDPNNPDKTKSEIKEKVEHLNLQQ